MPKTKVSVALAPGPDNALRVDAAGLFAPKADRGLHVVGTGQARSTPPHAPHFHADISVPGTQAGDFAILETDLNKDEKEAQWAVTHRCATDKVVVVLNRIKDGDRPFVNLRALVLRAPSG